MMLLTLRSLSMISLNFSTLFFFLEEGQRAAIVFFTVLAKAYKQRVNGHLSRYNKECFQLV